MQIEGFLQEARGDGALAIKCTAEATAPVAGPFADEGGLMPEYAIELLAQTLAAGQGYLALADDRPAAGGMLAGVDHFFWTGRPVAPGDQLLARVQSELAFGQFLVLSGAISRTGEEVARGRLKIRIEPDFGTKAVPLSPAPFAPLPVFSICRALRSTALQQITVAPNGALTGIFQFAPGFPGFAGHFPGKPLLPAVAQCAAVRILAEQYLAAELAPCEFQKMKWTRPILPDETVTITAALAGAGAQVSLSFAIAGASGPAGSGIVRYMPTSSGNSHATIPT